LLKTSAERRTFHSVKSLRWLWSISSNDMVKEKKWTYFCRSKGGIRSLHNTPAQDALHLRKVLKSMERIELYVTEWEWNKLGRSTLVEDAVIRNIEIIGEAAKRVSKLTKSLCPEIPWGWLEAYFGIPVMSPIVDVTSVCRAVLKLRELKPCMVSLLDEISDQEP
jgi:hypothetical protein